MKSMTSSVGNDEAPCTPEESLDVFGFEVDDACLAAAAAAAEVDVIADNGLLLASAMDCDDCSANEDSNDEEDDVINDGDASSDDELLNASGVKIDAPVVPKSSSSKASKGQFERLPFSIADQTRSTTRDNEILPILIDLAVIDNTNGRWIDKVFADLANIAADDHNIIIKTWSEYERLTKKNEAYRVKTMGFFVTSSGIHKFKQINRKTLTCTPKSNPGCSSGFKPIAMTIGLEFEQIVMKMVYGGKGLLIKDSRRRVCRKQPFLASTADAELYSKDGSLERIIEIKCMTGFRHCPGVSTTQCWGAGLTKPQTNIGHTPQVKSIIKRTAEEVRPVKSMPWAMAFKVPDFDTSNMPSNWLPKISSELGKRKSAHSVDDGTQLKQAKKGVHFEDSDDDDVMEGQNEASAEANSAVAASAKVNSADAHEAMPLNSGFLTITSRTQTDAEERMLMVNNGHRPRRRAPRQFLAGTSLKLLNKKDAPMRSYIDGVFGRMEADEFVLRECEMEVHTPKRLMCMTSNTARIINGEFLKLTSGHQRNRPYNVSPFLSIDTLQKWLKANTTYKMSVSQGVGDDSVEVVLPVPVCMNYKNADFDQALHASAVYYSNFNRVIPYTINYAVIAENPLWKITPQASRHPDAEQYIPRVVFSLDVVFSEECLDEYLMSTKEAFLNEVLKVKYGAHTFLTTMTRTPITSSANKKASQWGH